jgi:hypothetical protein
VLVGVVHGADCRGPSETWGLKHKK